jgi:ubiquinone/menaquinone biosynthesis C-methylase UbiE/DNA-binding MarR family transcriptional regulator
MEPTDTLGNYGYGYSYGYGTTPASENPKATVTPRERDDFYYKLLAGAPHTRLLESTIDLGLPQLLAKRGPLTAAEIAATLKLHPKRAAKWLVLLERIGLVRSEGDRYQNTERAIALHWDEHGRENFFLRDLLEFCRRVNAQDLTGLLRGTVRPEVMQWPPRTKEGAAHLELWMTITANEAIHALEHGTDWANTKTYLDVGGGDATIACALVRKFDHLQATVFNLPASAELARKRIAREGLEDRVNVVEGNFLENDLPKGFDRVQFSRVLADWDPDVCQMLLKKSRAALNPGGSLVISEPFDDTNYDLAVSWEYRYTFYDDFGVHTYKSVAMYKDMAKNAGFSDFKLVDRIDNTLYGVLTAR